MAQRSKELLLFCAMMQSLLGSCYAGDETSSHRHLFQVASGNTSRKHGLNTSHYLPTRHAAGGASVRDACDPIKYCCVEVKNLLGYNYKLTWGDTKEDGTCTSKFFWTTKKKVGFCKLQDCQDEAMRTFFYTVNGEQLTEKGGVMKKEWKECAYGKITYAQTGIIINADDLYDTCWKKVQHALNQELSKGKEFTFITKEEERLKEKFRRGERKRIRFPGSANPKEKKSPTSAIRKAACCIAVENGVAKIDRTTGIGCREGEVLVAWTELVECKKMFFISRMLDIQKKNDQDFGPADAANELLKLRWEGKEVADMYEEAIKRAIANRKKEREEAQFSVVDQGKQGKKGTTHNKHTFNGAKKKTKPNPRKLLKNNKARSDREHGEKSFPHTLIKVVKKLVGQMNNKGTIGISN